MRVAALMSGSGSNLTQILEDAANGKAYQVVCILTDNPQSNARSIAKQYGIDYEQNDINAFYRQKRLKKTDLSVRGEFDRETVKLLQPYQPDVVAYCGYMSIASPVLVKAFLGVNVHPADLSLLDEAGHRAFVGKHAVRAAILAGEKFLRSTTHLVEETVDGGRLLVRSAPMPVRLPKGFDPKDDAQVQKAAAEHQNRLKEQGDWVIFPKTLQWLAEKRFEEDKTGALYFDGKPSPHGVDAENAV